VSLVIPEQILCFHHAIFRMSHRAYSELERSAGRKNFFTITKKHAFCKCSFHSVEYGPPVPGRIFR
jgi:hypothetical protein